MKPRPAPKGRDAGGFAPPVAASPTNPTGLPKDDQPGDKAERPVAQGWLPHPMLSALLGAAWLLLQQSLAVPQVLTAVLLGVLLPRLLRRFLGPGLRVWALLPALRFGALVGWDIVVSNLAVARLVLSPWSRPQPAWIAVPHELESPVAITLLASIITMTPGTVSAVIDEERRVIHVHALDCDDAPGMVAQIKARYERPLKELIG